MVKDYKASDIKVLDEISHIRLNAGMYISNTETPTHLIEEALDNSLDEALSGFATQVNVIVDSKNHIYSVTDNGRGIPMDNDVPITISNKLFSGAKFQDSKTAYNICCLVGSTKLMLLNGENITIQEMSENPEKEYWGLSSTLHGEWEPTKLIHPQITGYVKSLIRVHLDNGLYEDCTEDHLWLMRDGSYKKAIDLKQNDSLMPCYYIEMKGWTYIRPNNSKEYIRNIDFENRSYVPLHRIIYEKINKKIPKFYGIHHEDTNKKNNYPNNLKLLHNFKEHLPEHAKINSERGLVFTDSLVKYNRSERGRQKSREVGIKFGSKNLISYAKSERNKKDKSIRLTNYNKSDDCIINKIFSGLKRLEKENIELTSENYKKHKIKQDISERLIKKYFNSFENLLEVYETRNHKVVKIEEISLENEVPVYDVYAPVNSNFVLSSGVVVHNSGLHGIGLVAINALSEKYEIDIYRDKKHGHFRFENSKFKEKTIKKFEGKVPFSTRIEFKPDKKIFQSLDLDVDRIRRRLLVATIELPNCMLILNIDGIEDRIKLTKNEYFQQRVLNGDTEVSSIIDISTKEDIEEFNCIFAYSFNGTITPKITSSVNLLPVDSGGTHVNIFMELLREFFVSRGKKAGLKFQPNDSLCGLRAYLSLELLKPEFSGQSKEKLINRKDYLSKLTAKLKQAIDTYFNTNPKDLENILLFFDDYRKN